MTVEELEVRIKDLEDQLKRVQDAEENKKLQRAYGYYLEHLMEEDVIELFSDSPEVTVIVRAGEFRGKESVKRFFRHGRDVEIKITKDPEFLHQVMQLSPIIDVAPDGKTAKGRWYGWICAALPVAKITRAIFQLGVYENEYIKEDGKWKFKKLQYYRIFQSPYEDGWVKTPDIFLDLERDLPPPDLPRTIHKPYPSGFVMPFHYKHPITGK